MSMRDIKMRLRAHKLTTNELYLAIPLGFIAGIILSLIASALMRFAASVFTGGLV